MSLGSAARRARRLPRDLTRWYGIARGERAGAGIRVYYGVDRIPGRHEPAHGGMIKFQSLGETFPNSARDFNVLYLGSSTRPADTEMLIRLAKRRGATLVWNQNGVAYPGWHGRGWERLNEALAEGLHAADHVVYQSEFCRLSADRFLGERHGPSEILHNPVDTARFEPGTSQEAAPTLLLGGNQYQRYRFRVALETLARLPQEWRLLVSGRISWHADDGRAQREAQALLTQSGLADRVELVGAYTQSEAPALVRRAGVLLHTKYNDPCPTIVLEAMASGLPVVYSESGGTPELVGEAGVGVPAPLDWEHDHPPDPELLAEAVVKAAGRRAELGAAARQRAVERFDLRPWVERHRVLFEELTR